MSKKLLLADDSITIQKVVGIIFANEDCSLAVVGDGDSALDAIRSERPDLIMADVVMPGKNGYELCAAVKQDPALRDVPVLLLTGTFEPFDEARARAAGVDDWIVKPFESQALLDKVAELLAKIPVSAADELSLPDLEDDFDLIENFVEPEGADADMWQELPGSSLEAPTADTVLGEQPSLSESTADDFAEPFSAEMANGSESAMPSVVEDLSDDFDSFDSSVIEPVSGSGTGDLAEDVDLPLSVAPEAEPAAVSAESDLWLDAADADEVLFLDEDDILDEDLLSEDLAAERTADLSFDSEADVFSPGVDSLTPSADRDFDATPAEEESFAEPVAEPVAEPEKRDGLGFFHNPGLVARIAAPPKRDGLGFFQSAGLIARLAQPAVVPVAVEETACVVESEEEIAVQAEMAAAEAPVAEAPVATISVEEVEQKVQGLSEEDLTRIVEKVAAGVIEKLADTILERIAWEVVPDLAEAIIREEIRHITAKL